MSLLSTEYNNDKLIAAEPMNYTQYFVIDTMPCRIISDIESTNIYKNMPRIPPTWLIVCIDRLQLYLVSYLLSATFRSRLNLAGYTLLFIKI